eukprot:4217062-Prymnesium_polylepis.1
MDGQEIRSGPHGERWAKFHGMEEARRGILRYGVPTACSRPMAMSEAAELVEFLDHERDDVLEMA